MVTIKGAIEGLCLFSLLEQTLTDVECSTHYEEGQIRLRICLDFVKVEQALLLCGIMQTKKALKSKFS